MNDAQEISDPAWIEFGLARGWSLLTQDKRIRTQAEALALLTRYAGSIFCLSSGELPIATRAARFDTHRAIIDGFTARNAGFFVVYENGVVRRWP